MKTLFFFKKKTQVYMREHMLKHGNNLSLKVYLILSSFGNIRIFFNNVFNSYHVKLLYHLSSLSLLLCVSCCTESSSNNAMPHPRNINPSILYIIWNLWGRTNLHIKLWWDSTSNNSKNLYYTTKTKKKIF